MSYVFLTGDVLIEPLCPDSKARDRESMISPSPSVRTTPSSGSTYGPTSSVQSSISGSGSSSGSWSGDVKMAERKVPCKAYTPISVCSRNVVSCFRGGEVDLEQDNSLESAVQVPWIAHVLMGSGSEPDTYLDINLIQ